MAHREPVTVTIHSRDNRELPHTSSEIIQIQWNRQERVRRSIRMLLLLWLATFISVFIPILHFFLVPVLFISSFVMAIDQWNETLRSDGGRGMCPKCNSEFTIQKGRWSKRFTNNCDHCHEDLEVLI